MPRKPRIHYPGAIYHAMARGVDGREIFADDHDRRRFLDEMRRYEREMDARILAYCLMGNHFHIAIRVAASPLGSFIQRLSGGYAGTFNHRHERVGHLFQSRHKAKLCLDDRYLATVIHYIHMNPVRAGLVADPGDWPWSSYTPMSGPLPNLDGFDPWSDDEESSSILGATPTLRNLDEIGAFVSGKASVTLTAMKSRFREKPVVSARRDFVLEALKNGHSLASAAKWLGMSRSTVGRYTVEVTQQREV